MRIVLQEHLDQLRARGADETTLHAIETELRRWDDTIEKFHTPSQ